MANIASYHPAFPLVYYLSNLSWQFIGDHCMIWKVFPKYIIKLKKNSSSQNCYEYKDESILLTKSTLWAYEKDHLEPWCGTHWPIHLCFDPEKSPVNLRLSPSWHTNIMYKTPTHLLLSGYCWVFFINNQNCSDMKHSASMVWFFSLFL